MTPPRALTLCIPSSFLRSYITWHLKFHSLLIVLAPQSSYTFSIFIADYLQPVIPQIFHNLALKASYLSENSACFVLYYNPGPMTIPVTL